MRATAKKILCHGNSKKKMCHDWEKSWKLWIPRVWHLTKEELLSAKGFEGWIEVNYKEEGKGRDFSDVKSKTHLAHGQ